MTELPGTSSEFVLNNGLNVLWGPLLEREENFDGRSFEPMNKEEVIGVLERFFKEITEQGGKIVDALDVEYEDKELGGIYGSQKAIRKGRVYIIEK